MWLGSHAAVAAAPFQSLAWESPYVVSAALKSKKKKKKKGLVVRLQNWLASHVAVAVA